MTNALPNVEQAVLTRYSDGAKAREEALCCPVSFNPEYLAALPEEILERDYGCGDPTEFVRKGDVVLDLGSGAGKVCWIAAQVAGPDGRVIGIDMNPDMLALAQKHHAAIAQRVGFDTVTFHRGMIQDLRLDLDLMEKELATAPVRDVDSWLEFRRRLEGLRQARPLVADNSVDIVLSNCVLNLVRPEDKQRLVEEIYRVVRDGGRVAISDIVADEEVPLAMQQDPELWSGCISGAYTEEGFLDAFAAAGFHGIGIAKRDPEPWRTVGGIEFRSVTVVAFKGKEGPCVDFNQAVIYRGPFRRVCDDDGHEYVRGERTAVCGKTYRLLQREPYSGAFVPIEPLEPVSLERAKEFACDRPTKRHPRETKGSDYDATTDAAPSCC